jgi:hypothetical protein
MFPVLIALPGDLLENNRRHNRVNDKYPFYYCGFMLMRVDGGLGYAGRYRRTFFFGFA